VALSQIRIRAAGYDDVPILRRLIDASVRRLQAEDYTAEQIDHALQTVFGVDSQLIADGTYLVAEARGAGSADAGNRESAFVVAGCGGWSRRKKLYGGDAWTEERSEFLDPARDAAKIRAFFIAPDWARMGIGSRILRACEAAAMAEGFRRFEMGATLTGVKLFRTHGYVEMARVQLDIGGGEMLPVVRMEKRI
jgi:GNAT superfamily N-acetyltransferase